MLLGNALGKMTFHTVDINIERIVLKMAALILSIVCTSYSDSLFICTVCNDDFLTSSIILFMCEQ